MGFYGGDLIAPIKGLDFTPPSFSEGVGAPVSCELSGNRKQQVVMGNGGFCVNVCPCTTHKHTQKKSDHK